MQMTDGNKRFGPVLKEKNNFFRQRGLLVKAQCIAEYAVFFAAIIAGLIAFQVYFSRSLQGNCKNYSDNIGEQFSPGLSRYNSVRETLPFAKSTRTTSGQGSYEEIKENQVTRTVDAEVVPVAKSADEFFSEDAPAELKNIFSTTIIATDYNVENVQSVVDDFSAGKLVDDSLF